MALNTDCHLTYTAFLSMMVILYYLYPMDVSTYLLCAEHSTHLSLTPTR